MQEALVDYEEQQHSNLLNTTFTVQQAFEQNARLRQESDSLYQKLDEMIKKIRQEKEDILIVQETPRRFTKEVPDPMDRISNDQISIGEKTVTLNIQNTEWWHIIDSNSMDPVIDKGSTILTVKPKSDAEIRIGDIIVFKTATSDNNIVHRVINISRDDLGAHYTTKGDNNAGADHEKIRFNDVLAVVVGILY
ncbi:MAG: signal peptidase I [Candidatus Woesearchaeota archaeon]